MRAEIALPRRIDLRTVVDIGEVDIDLHHMLGRRPDGFQTGIDAGQRQFRLGRDIFRNRSIRRDADGARDPDQVTGPYNVTVMTDRRQLPLDDQPLNTAHAASSFAFARARTAC